MHKESWASHQNSFTVLAMDHDMPVSLDGLAAVLFLISSLMSAKHVALILNNAKIGAQIACHLSHLESCQPGPFKRAPREGLAPDRRNLSNGLVSEDHDFHGTNPF